MLFHTTDSIKSSVSSELQENNLPRRCRVCKTIFRPPLQAAVDLRICKSRPVQSSSHIADHTDRHSCKYLEASAIAAVLLPWTPPSGQSLSLTVPQMKGRMGSGTSQHLKAQERSPMTTPTVRFHIASEIAGYQAHQDQQD